MTVVLALGSVRERSCRLSLKEVVTTAELAHPTRTEQEGGIPVDEDTRDPIQDEPESDGPRREFLTKAASAMGAIAAAGVGAAMLSSEAEAQPRVRAGAQAIIVQNTPLRFERTAQGQSFAMQGPEIAKVLAREGLIPKEAANSATAGISIMIRK